MKRIVAALLAVALLFSLAACGKSETVKRAEDKIAEIGEVNLDSEKAIKAAERAYKLLDDKEKDKVGNYDNLLAARETYEKLVLEDKAVETENAIDAIGEVTPESEDLIKAARSAYDATEEEIKPYVSNYKKLEEAEAKYEQLLVDNVVTLINGIGTVTIESGAKIRAARTAYDDLTEARKRKISNVAVLTVAEAEYTKACQAKANELLGKMRLKNDEVRKMKFYYPMHFPYYPDLGYWAADVRSFALPYIGMNDNKVWMNFVCHYTGDDWIFFEDVTFAVDEERYYKSFDYFDVERDNDSGDVWETATIHVTDSDIEMMWAIVNSEKTIIRFSGDHTEDVVVSQADKAAIKEALVVYEVLQQVKG